MMNIDRYVIRSFLSSYFILLLAGVALYVFADVVVNLDEFTEQAEVSVGSVLWKIADYHGYRLPLYFHLLGGVMMALAAGFCFAMMLRNNELVPLVAAGMPLQRLVMPVLLCSVVLVGAWLYNSERIIPAVAPKLARHFDDLNDSRKVEVLCVRDDHNAILSASELHVNGGWLREVYIIEPGDDRVPEHLISADAARWDARRRTWVLDRGARLTVTGAFDPGELGGTVTREPVDEYAFTLAPEEILLRQSSQWAELMSIRQMNALLQSKNLPNLPAVARSRFVRFTQPLLMWIMILLITPFFLTREPTNVLVAGGKALLLGGLCFLITFMGQNASLGQSWLLAPALPVLIFGPVAVVHIANAKT